MAKKSLFWTVTTILVLLVGYVLTVNVILPVTSRNPLPVPAVPKSEAKGENSVKKTEKADNSGKKAAKQDKDAKKPDSKVKAPPAEEPVVTNSSSDNARYFELKKNESFLRSRYNLAAEDSAYLILDLVKKVATLEMKGIPLHDTDIKDVWISNSIKLYHTEVFLRWIAQPFVLKDAVSTIVRVPFIVKIAPKDTIEANKSDALPAPRRTEDVYIVMNFERNLQLIIQQAEKSEGEDKARIDSLKNSYVNLETRKSLVALSKFSRDPVVPRIIITLPKSEAIVLYRALPQKLKMLIRI